MIPHFVGRLKECRAILDQLTNGSTRLVDVWGPPGFGKTSVAIDVAHQLRQMKIPVYFTSLRGMTTKDDLVSKLLGIFVDAKQAFHISPSDWLIQCLQQRQTPLVLILDNADDVLESGDTKVKEDIIRFIEDILAQCSHIKILITSRESHEYLSYKFPIHLERVGVLDGNDSGYLVKTLLPYVSESDRNNIVKACGQVPLAMRLMCSMVREENVSVSELLEETKISPLVEVLDNERFSSDARLKNIINTSFQRLTAHERDAFVSLAVFPGRFGIDEAKDVLNLKTITQTKKRIASLKRKALIECTGDFESFIVHSLLRSFVEEMITNDQMQVNTAVFSTAQRRFYDYNLSNYEAANEKYLTGRSNEALAAFLSCRENVILSLLNGVKNEKLYDKVIKVLSKGELFLYTVLINEEVLFNTIYAAAVEEAKAKENWVDKQNLLAAKSFEQWGWFSSDRQTWDYSLYSDCSCVADCPVKLLCYHGIYQILCGKVDEGVWLLKNCVERLSERCDENVLKALVYQLPAVYGQPIKQEHETVSDHLNLHASESRSTSTNEEDWVQTFSSKMIDDAVFSFVRMKLLAKGGRAGDCDREFKFVMGLGEIFGRCHADGLGILDLRKFNKEFIKGARCNEALFTSTLKLFGVDPMSVDFNQSIFTVIETMQDYDFAVRWINDHLNLYMYLIAGSIPGGERRDLHKKNTSTDFLLKSIVLMCKTSIENTLKTHELVPGIDFKDLAVTYDNFGILLKLANDYSGAIAYYQQAIRVRNEHAGNPVDIAESLARIGCVYFEMNKDIEGEKAFQSALELRKQSGVYDHLDTAVFHDTLATNYFSRGNFTKALIALQEALAVREKHMGEHPDTAGNLNNIGYAYSMKGDFESGRDEFLKAVDMYTKLDDKGIGSATSCINLASSYYDLGNLDLARQFCQEALVRQLELLGEHIETADSLHLEGLIHAKMEDNKSAVEAFQKASKMRSNLLGDHEDTAESFRFLGQRHYRLDEHESAVKAFQEAARIRSNTLGNQEGIVLKESYRKMTVIYHWLGKAQNGLGDLRGALESLQESLRLTREASVEDLDTGKALQLLNSIYEALSAGELDCD